MKKIGVFLHCTPGHGGTFQYNQTILSALTSLPIDSYEIVAASIHEEWLAYAKGLEIQAVPLPKVHWAQELGERWKEKGLSYALYKEVTGDIHPIGKLLQEQKCDLWIFPSQEAYTFQLDVPSLGVVLDLMHRYESSFPEVSQDGEYEVREWLLSNIVEHSTAVLVDSEIGKQQVIESYGTNADKIFALPFVAPIYIYNANSYIEFANELKEKLPDKYLFYPAQFWEHKNHKRIVEAVYLLKQKDINVNFVFVGAQSGKHREKVHAELLELIDQYSLQQQIHFLGYVKDEEIPFIYQNARGLVMPTFFGPTNIPPIEAMAMGCPVAISNIYGMPAQLGDAALFFDPNLVEEMVDCIQILWNDDHVCEELIQKGIKQAENWGLAQFRDRLVQIINELI